MNRDQVDIWSKGEVIRYLVSLFEKAQIKDCIHLELQQRYLKAYYPKCTEDWASRERAYNVTTSVTGYGAPSSYYWPACPKDCPAYSKAENLLKSLNAHPTPPLTTPLHSTNHLMSEPYVDPTRIQELKNITGTRFDLLKLIELCEELNISHSKKVILAIPTLVRSILDHVPPIFGQKSFKEVLNNYSGAKSFKDSMTNLENSSRKIADAFLHTQIRAKESLPTETQVNFKNDLDVLLQEIVRLLK
ncbi:MAG TPA: hypothetical protein VMX75_05690 [Spirochaetia bacterium]|nr:hypothetical protein [Spirochaetia bacterium]